MNNFIEIDIKNLVKAAWNYKEEDPTMQTQLVANIRKHGQLENIIVRPIGKKKYEVVNGNHRLDAFNELGFEKVMCCDVGEISDAHAARIAIETNETKFKSDNIKLAKLLDGIKVEFDITEIQQTMPFKLEEIQNFNTMLNFDWDKPADNLGANNPPVAPAPAQQQSTGSNPADRPTVENGTPDNRTINLHLPTEVAEQFEHQIKRIKKLLYPEQIPEHVAMTMPIQAMLEVLANTDDKKFS